MKTSYATLPSLGLLVFTLGSSTLAAQIKQAGYQNSWGNSTAGCAIDVLAKASYLPTTRPLWTGRTGTVNTALSYAHGLGTVTLFGATREAVYGQVSAEAMDGRFVLTQNGTDYSSVDSARTSIRLRLGGFTVPDGNQSGTQSLFLNANHDQDILHDTRVIMVGGYLPVTVEYTLGAGIGINAAAVVDLSLMGSSVMGSVNTRGYGDGSVAVGIPGCRTGVDLRFDACRTEVGIGLDARPSSLSGQFTLRVDSIFLRLFVFVEALWWRRDEEVFRYSAPALLTRTYPLF